MRQAIVTHYVGPTDYRGARVVARCQAGRVVVSWNYALDVDDNHEAAARKLAVRFGWLVDGIWVVGGGMPNGTGNVYLLLDVHGRRAAINAARKRERRERHA